MLRSSEQGSWKTKRYHNKRRIICFCFFFVHWDPALNSVGVWCILFIISEVTKVDIDMEGQKVFIESTLSSEELLATLKKTGRECSYVGVKQQ